MTLSHKLDSSIVWITLPCDKQEFRKKRKKFLSFPFLKIITQTKTNFGRKMIRLFYLHEAKTFEWREVFVLGEHIKLPPKKNHGDRNDADFDEIRFNSSSESFNVVFLKIICLQKLGVYKTLNQRKEKMGRIDFHFRGGWLSFLIDRKFSFWHRPFHFATTKREEFCFFLLTRRKIFIGEISR